MVPRRRYQAQREMELQHSYAAVVLRHQAGNLYIHQVSGGGSMK
jgi:hypothetical protein